MNRTLPTLVLALMAIPQVTWADIQSGKIDPALSEQWEPIPPVVSTESVPSDAIVLFDGNSTAQWLGDHSDVIPWTLSGNTLTVKPKSGGIRTKEKFCDVQLHIEWKSPDKISNKSGQLQGNSGVYLMGRYEVQILDSYQNQTYVNGQAASIYKQHAPLVNATKPTGQWNSYDIIFTAPRFKEQALLSPAKMTVLHNGVLVHNNAELKGATTYNTWPTYKAHGCAPIYLQDHGDKVSFRNIWARKL